METLLQDIKYGFRSLISKPGVMLVALVALTLGIGANTALFSILYSVFWKPLPSQEPDRLAIVWETKADLDSFQNVVNPANYSDWKERNRVFTDIAAFAVRPSNLTGVGNPEEVQVGLATPNLFSVLGVQAARGRTFVQQDGSTDTQIVILTNGIWRRRFGGDRNLVNKQICLNGRPHLVVGILPADFRWFIRESAFISGKAPEIFKAYPITDERRVREGRYLTTVARLKPGVTPQEANANMKLLSKQLESEFHSANAGWSSNVVPLREQLSGHLRKPLWILAGAVVFVLLIACTNVANLMLSRAAVRGREIAVRTALGAGRSRIFRQLLTESVLLSLMGGLAGLVFSIWGIQALALLGQGTEIEFEAVRLNIPILAFTLGLSVLTGILFGIIPAFDALRWNLQEQLKEGSKGTSGTRASKIRRALVISQVAFALILLSGAGLLIQSFAKLTSVNPGFDPKQVLTFRINLASPKYSERPPRIPWFRQATEKLAAMPGVESVGMISFLPFGGPPSGTSFLIQGRPLPPEGQEPDTDVFVTDNGFFQTLRIPLKRGRWFLPAEMQVAKHVVLINEALARKFFPGEDPIGKKIRIFMGDEIPYSEIIGIVGDIKKKSLQEEVEPAIYWPHPELPFPFMTLIARTQQDPLKLAPTAVRVVHELEPQQPLADVRTLQDWLGDSTAKAEFSMTLLGILSTVALILAIAGVYAVMAHGVLQRTQEIGIRMALGASKSDVFRLILKEGSKLILAGTVIGFAATVALTRLMKSMLFETSTSDPVTFVAVTALLTLTALAACWIPSRRAASVNPLRALHYE